MYVEFATFIPLTFIVFYQLFILAIKAIGPLPEIGRVSKRVDAGEKSEVGEETGVGEEAGVSENTESGENDGATEKIESKAGNGSGKIEKSPDIGLFYFGLIFSAYVIVFEIINLISLALKPQAQLFEPKFLSPLLYLIHSNRLFFTIITFALAIWIMLGIFISISKVQILVYTAGVLSLTIYLLDLANKETIDALDFLKSSIGALILVAIVFWFVLLILNKILMNLSQQGNKNAGTWLKPMYLAPKSFARILTGAKYELIAFVVTWFMFMLSWADIPIF